LLRNKLYDYPGKQKGSFELTSEKVYCEKCYESLFSKKDPSIDDTAQLVMKMTDGKYKEALKEISKCFDKNKKDNWYNKANILRNLKRNKEAILCYNEALFLDTHYIKAWYRKGQTLYEEGDFNNAIKCFENIIELEKQTLNNNGLKIKSTQKGFVHESGAWSFGAMFYMALCYMREKKFDDADLIFSFLYNKIRHLPPFDSIQSDKVIAFLVENTSDVLDLLEPNMVAEFGTMGSRH